MLIAFCLFLSTFSFLGVMYLLIVRFVVVKENKKTNSGFYLPKVKELPKSYEIDPKLSLLKDVIQTCKNESWSGDISQESYSLSRTYSICLNNAKGNLKVKSRLRLGHHENEIPRLVSFIIVDESGSISYEENEIANIICLDFIWNDYFIPYTNKLHDNEMMRYEGVKKSIIDKLVSLKRQRKLDDLDI